MLAEVDKKTRNNEWIVFLGWAPHPMNTRFQIEYLSGGDAYFGPNYGGAEVLTNIRAGYASECPNVTKFVSNLKFTLDMEGEMMGAILDGGEEPKAAATAWLRAHRDVVGPWLEGVTTFDGGNAAEAVAKVLAD
jgi:glycine betaine/proline transport system substrate-binding protein